MTRSTSRLANRHLPATAGSLLVLSLALVGCGGDRVGPRHTGARRSAGTSTSRSPTSVGFDAAGWSTDFTRHDVPLDTITSGGPGRDGIPPLDHPRFVGIAAASGFVTASEPVITVEISGHARAYPLQILIWHEIVNDTLAGRPIAVTYCPLCNTAIVYSRALAGRVLRFGTTGNLRNSDLVMWDRHTESWWQQYDGRAIVGSLTGRQLTPVSSETLSFADFRARYPTGQVLSRNTGFHRPYGQNPYVRYDTPTQRPFLYQGRLDTRLPPLERVELITVGSDAAVVPFDSLRRNPATAVTVGGLPAVVAFQAAVSSPLDAPVIRDSRAVGTAAAFDRRLRGTTLSFSSPAPGILVDRQSGSRWDITGRAISGPDRGSQLHRLRDVQAFWFAVAAFVPHARLMKP